MATAAALVNAFEYASAGGGWKKTIQKGFKP
jgi:hypothetical protein